MSRTSGVTRRNAAAAMQQRRWTGRVVLAAILAALLMLAVGSHQASGSTVDAELDIEMDLEADMEMDAVAEMERRTRTATDSTTESPHRHHRRRQHRPHHDLLEEEPFTCKTSGDCNGHGVCKSGTCMCIQPWTGTSCDHATCPGQCSGTGLCDSTTGLCSCYNSTQLAIIYPHDGPEHEWGFEGADCSLKTCFTDCGERHGHGSCNKTTGMCECRRGRWGPEGMHCNSILCDDKCNSHGFCVDDRCVCDVATNRLSGWTGDKCEKPLCPNHCFEDAGLGKCVDGACKCETGWYGDDCSQRTCPTNYSPMAWTGAAKVMCSGHGNCTSGACQCATGFSGIDCSVRMCPGLTIHGLSSNISCSNHGTCQANGMCVCNAGYKGSDCFDRVCSTDCGTDKNRGSCDGETGDCICNAGWYGADCSFKRCDDSCNGNGQCLEGACACKPGFRGAYCEQSVCGGNCSFALGQGECMSNKCVCAEGFNGAECQYKDCPRGTDPETGMHSITCSGNGVCVAGECACNPAWDGPDCTKRACPYNCNDVGECEPDGTCTCPAGGLNGRGGFLGKFCETAICPSNCGEANEQGECLDGKCVCAEGFGLPDCLYASCPTGLPPLSSPYTKAVACSGIGDCVKGACVCPYGTTGAACADKPCLNNCNGADHGTCQSTGFCLCNDRYNGTDCSNLGCPLGCSGHGACLGNGQCQCDGRWTGDRCEILKCPNDCSSAGECVRTEATSETPAVERCGCDPGFQGPDCSQPICLPLNEDGKMCKGKGHCVIDLHGNHVCRCNSPFVGGECGNGACNSTCSFHGTCIGRKGLPDKCECDDGWYGEQCERTGNCDPEDCFGRGTCVSGPKNAPTCQCNAPFGGPDCSLCVHGCSGHGTCSPNGCKCEDGWMGPLCDRREDCDPKDCGGKGHGTCVTDANGQPTCKCKFPWTDFDCLQCLLTCNEHGECNEKGKCTCDKGWKGDNCDHYGECPNNCSEKGQCVGDEIGDPVCKCQKGYGGKDCGALVCKKECPAHSTCLDEECVCEPGWTGDTCEERDDCPQGCNDVGTCMADLAGKPFCKCQIGRGGPACEFQMCNNACSDHGSCFMVKGKQKCKCDAGFGGPDCSVVDCSVWANCGGSSHGECGQDAHGQPKCLCEHPYTGTNCTAIKCSKQQCIHGTCSDEKCTCEAGWKGPKCDYRVPCPAPGCGDEGRCIGDGNGNGKCECNPGFTGPNCLDVLCDDKCSGHGKCLNLGCVCDSGFHGEKCEITAPCPSNCNNHGECNYDEKAKKSVCDCEDMYDSAVGVDDCSVARGTTWLDTAGKLQYNCTAPYYGNLCQSKGCTLACKNGGTCALDGLCDCPAGFQGADCSETVCPGGCSGGGECDLKAKQCRCFFGYSGASCSVYNEAVCLSTCSFKCSLHGAHGLVHVTDLAGVMHWVRGRECHQMCKITSLCQVMFGSGHAADATREFVTIAAPVAV